MAQAKQVKKLVEVEQTETPELGALIDEAGRQLVTVLDLELKLSKTAAVKNLTVERKKLTELDGRVQAAMAEGLAADTALALEGAEFQAEIGAKATSRVITNMKKLLGFLKPADRISITSVKLKDADAYLTKVQLAQVITTTQEGRRSFKITPLA